MSVIPGNMVPREGGWWGKTKKIFHGGSMDIFWNCTVKVQIVYCVIDETLFATVHALGGIRFPGWQELHLCTSNHYIQ